MATVPEDNRGHAGFFELLITDNHSHERELIMSLFLTSGHHINAWQYQPEHRTETDQLKRFYAGHDGELFGYTLSIAVRDWRDFYDTKGEHGTPKLKSSLRDFPNPNLAPSGKRN